MFDVNIATVLIVSLLVMVALGVHIAIALGMASALGIFLVTGGSFNVVLAMLGSTAYEALRAYEFAVIPLFMLMGEFVSRSGAVTDVYRAIHRGLQRLPGRLAVATLLGNAIFSFVTGVSIASAAAFSRIAYPEMKRFGYHRGFALGAVAGSSCLGMLIPPSVLMIVWGLLTERSIGQIFLAGVLPGLLLVSLFVCYVLVSAVVRPALVGGGKAAAAGASPDDAAHLTDDAAHQTVVAAPQARRYRAPNRRYRAPGRRIRATCEPTANLDQRTGHPVGGGGRPGRHLVRRLYAHRGRRRRRLHRPDAGDRQGNAPARRH